MRAEKIRSAINTDAGSNPVAYNGFLKTVNEPARIRFVDGHGKHWKNRSCVCPDVGAHALTILGRAQKIARIMSERGPVPRRSGPVRALAARLSRALLRGELTFPVDLVPLSHRLAPRARLNWALAELSARLRLAQPLGRPTVLQIEPTSRCNLRCPACPSTAGLGRPRGDMDPELFSRVVADLADALLLVLFWDWGEPFLNPHAPEMIRRARDAGARVVASTNAHPLADQALARRVVASGLDVLVVSVDGTTQESYGRYRAGGSLASALAGLRSVVAEKRRLRSATPLVNLRFIVMGHNEAELPRLAEFARPLGVDLLSLRRFYAVPGTGRDVPAGLEPGDACNRLPPVLPGEAAPRRLGRNPCRTLWSGPAVHADGTVCGCSQDFRGAYPLGNLARTTISRIWSCDAYRERRRRFVGNYRGLPLCGVCSCGYAGGDLGRDATAEAVWLAPGGGASGDGRHSA